MDEALKILEHEFRSEPGSFLLGLRSDLAWDRDAFSRLENAKNRLRAPSGRRPSFALIVLSGVSAFYFFFNVPVWCGAEGRSSSCRNNSYGALMGCHLRQHKWQKLKMLFWSTRRARLRQELFQSAERDLLSGL
ncbi:hypothetical protein ACWGH3_10340 [Streptomyces sp. NPDC054884]